MEPVQCPASVDAEDPFGRPVEGAESEIRVHRKHTIAIPSRTESAASESLRVISSVMV